MFLLFYKQLKKNGFEYDYNILGEIFNSSTTIGKLSQAFTQEPPTSDEEREIEECFLSKSVYIGSEAIGVDENGFNDINRKRKIIGSSSEHRCKEAKNSRLDKLDATLIQWS
ncbi:hypothetical protein VNO77_24982 [Canavalia gladiata]|uniref:Uncharacterized protein n=1 Tax=Canavalia gladiata TaxID=3824 RepID=A0AAN9QD46_CANGL